MSDPKAVRTLLATDPKPMQRPVLVHEGRAIIGRPPRPCFVCWSEEIE